MLYSINPIQDGGQQKGPLTSFSPVTSTNVRISLKTFLTFSFNPFASLLSNFKATRSTSLKLSNLNQEYPSKKWLFWSDPCKIEDMKIFLIEMPVTKLSSQDQIYNIV